MTDVLSTSSVNLMLFLYLIEQHIIKVYCGVEVQIHVFLASVLDAFELLNLKCASPCIIIQFK